MKNTILFGIAFSIFCIVNHAQAQQAQADHPPCLAITGSILDSLVGHWTVDWSYRTAPGQFVESQAHSRFRADLNGCAIVENFEGTLQGHPFSAMTMMTQKSNGLFDRVRVDSEHGSFTQSHGFVQNDTLIFEWQRDLGKRVLRTRHYFFNFAKSSFAVEFYLSRSEESPWELVQRARYRRNKNHE